MTASRERNLAWKTPKIARINFAFLGDTIQWKQTIMPIDLAKYTSPYRSKHTIIHALAWSSVKKFFSSVEREDIAEHVKTLQIQRDILTIRTEKPVINTEILHYQSDLIHAVNAGI